VLSQRSREFRSARVPAPRPKGDLNGRRAAAGAGAEPAWQVRFLPCAGLHWLAPAGPKRSKLTAETLVLGAEALVFRNELRELAKQGISDVVHLKAKLPHHLELQVVEVGPGVVA